MSDDEILLMAEQSVNKLCVIAVTNDDLIAFAREIAAKEREACAKVCEGFAEDMLKSGWENGSFALTGVADTIRARGE
jgi:fructose 1,6-bisphosphatase